MSKRVIGITGLARAGKDTFCQLLIEELDKRGLNAKRFAFADALKNEIQEPLKSLSGIDIWNCTAQEKELVRDYLVAVGKIKRHQYQGKYWTTIVEKAIEQSDVDVAIVTDARYDVFPEDEVWWVKDHMRGLLVHVSRYQQIDVTKLTPEYDDLPFQGGKICGYFNPSNLKEQTDAQGRIFLSPPNKDESDNDPKLKEKANFIVEWETAPTPEKAVLYCRSHVVNFLDNLPALGWNIFQTKS